MVRITMNGMLIVVWQTREADYLGILLAAEKVTSLC